MMKKYKLILCSDFIKINTVRDCFDAGWLPRIEDYSTLADLGELDKFSEEEVSLGVKGKKIVGHFGSEYRPVVILTSFPLSSGKHFEQHDEGIVISATLWSSDYPEVPRWILMAIFVAKAVESLEITCNTPDCLCSTKYSNDHTLCLSCQDKLLRPVFEKNSAVYLALLDFFQGGNVTDKIINIADSVLQSRTWGQSPVIDDMLTDLILDHKIGCEGSKNRKWLEEKSVKIKSRKKEIEEKYTSKLENLPQKPMLIVARRWNSWTPAMPTLPDEIQGDHGKGGGYFFSDGTTRIVVDPGFGFLNILYRNYRITVSDIDAIIITHDHPDHWADLSTILAMRFTRKSECKDKLKIFMNPSSYLMHEKFTRYYSSILDQGKPEKVQPGTRFQVGDIVVETISAEHDEIAKYADTQIIDELSSQGGTESLGLKMTSSNTVMNYTFSILGDSEFPKDREKLQSLTSFFQGSDVLVLHLGSIEDSWCDKNKIPASSVRYGKDDNRKHLGINGCIRFSRILKSGVVIITEFGEELKLDSGRTAAVSLIKELSGCHHVLPADIELCLVKDEKGIYCRCSDCGKCIPVKYVQFSENKEGALKYVSQAGCDSGREHEKF